MFFLLENKKFIKIQFSEFNWWKDEKLQNILFVAWSFSFGFYMKKEIPSAIFTKNKPTFVLLDLDGWWKIENCGRNEFTDRTNLWCRNVDWEKNNYSEDSGVGVKSEGRKTRAESLKLHWGVAGASIGGWKRLGHREIICIYKESSQEITFIFTTYSRSNCLTSSLLFQYHTHIENSILLKNFSTGCKFSLAVCSSYCTTHSTGFYLLFSIFCDQKKEKKNNNKSFTFSSEKWRTLKNKDSVKNGKNQFFGLFLTSIRVT